MAITHMGSYKTEQIISQVPKGDEALQQDIQGPDKVNEQCEQCCPKLHT